MVVVVSPVCGVFADSTKVDITSSGVILGIESVNENAKLQIKFTNDYDDVVHNNTIDNFVLEFDFDGQGSLTGTNLLKTGNHYKVTGTNLKKRDFVILNYDGKLNDKDVNNVRLYPAMDPCKSWDGANGAAYTKGQVLLYDGKHYECISNHSIIIDQAMPWQVGKTYNIGDIVSYGGAAYKVNSPHTPTLDAYTIWQMWNTYKVGDIVERNGKYYQVTEEHTPEADKVFNWNITSTYKTGDIIRYNNNYYEVKTAHTPYLETVPEWKVEKTYNTGDKVSFNGGYYECTGSYTPQGTIGVISGKHAAGDYFSDKGSYYKVTQDYNFVIINDFFDMSPHMGDIVYCKQTNNYYLCSREDSNGRGYTIYGSSILASRYTNANINEIGATSSHWKPYAIKNEAYWAPSNTANNLFQSYKIKDETYWSPENYTRAFTPYVLKDEAYWNPKNYTKGFETYTLRGVDYWNPQNYSAGFKQIVVEDYDYSANVKLNYTIMLDSSFDEDSKDNLILLPQGNGSSTSYSIKTNPSHGTANTGIRDGKWVVIYTPVLNYSGTDLVVLNQDNGDGQVIETKINITIKPINDPPSNTTKPAVSGSYWVGQTLNATTGMWNDNTDLKSGNLAYSYQWQRTSGLEALNVTDIAGATKDSYKLTSDDRDEYIRVKITCTDDGEGLPYNQSTTAYSSWEKVGSPEVSIKNYFVTSSNRNNGFAKIGDTITLTITPSEAITAPKVMIGGSEAEVTKQEGVWSAVYKMSDDNTEGYIPVTISDYSSIEKNADGKNFVGQPLSVTSSVYFDKTNPSININGDSITSIVVGSEYIDPGASATDNFDIIKDEQILVQNNVDTLVPGCYSVTYSVYDSAGNAAVPSIRTVNVLSDNADLKSITSSEGKLTPAFSPSKTQYQINVSSSTQSISVAASVYDAGASIAGGNTRVLDLKIGDNDLSFTVIAQDQKTQKTYKVRVVRVNYPTIVSNANTSTNNINTPTTPTIVTVPEEKIPEAFSGYQDIKGHWAETDISELMKDKIVSGYDDNTIKPDSKITRAEMAKLIVSVLKLKIVNTGSIQYKDAGEFAEWAKPYIETALENKLMIGYDDSSFKASKYITREEAAAVLIRAFAFGKAQSTELSFTDSGNIHTWALEYVAKAVEMNIIKGYPGNMFYPEKEVTRAESFVMINRSVKLINVTVDNK